MEEDILIYTLCGVYFFQFLLIIGTGIIYSYHSNRNITDAYIALSVVIPFRDEEDRIGELLTSINNLQLVDVKVEFIFVNDNSKDQTADKIDKELNNTVLIINSQSRGKKQAIRQGIARAKHDFVLTWDADITIPSNYFQELRFLERKDMWVLPVRLKARNLVGKLGAIDHIWLQMFAYAYSKIKEPIVASGANLLFEKAAFNEVDQQRTDYNIQSGDDMFLLEAFKKSGKSIGLSKLKGLEVITDSPDSFEGLIEQRKRWAVKMKHMPSNPANLFGVLIVLLSILNVFMLVWGALALEVLILLPFGLKYLSEYLFLRHYKGLSNLGEDLYLVFLHQFFFPFYLLAIVVSKPQEQKWS